MVVVDYTHPSSVNANAEFYAKHGLNFVMGTTGGDRYVSKRVFVWLYWGFRGSRTGGGRRWYPFVGCLGNRRDRRCISFFFQVMWFAVDPRIQPSLAKPSAFGSCSRIRDTNGVCRYCFSSPVDSARQSDESNPKVRLRFFRMICCLSGMNTERTWHPTTRLCQAAGSLAQISSYGHDCTGHGRRRRCSAGLKRAGWVFIRCQVDVQTANDLLAGSYLRRCRAYVSHRASLDSRRLRQGFVFDSFTCELPCSLLATSFNGCPSTHLLFRTVTALACFCGF